MNLFRFNQPPDSCLLIPDFCIMSYGHAIAIAALPTEPLPYGSANDFLLFTFDLINIPSWSYHPFTVVTCTLVTN